MRWPTMPEPSWHSTFTGNLPAGFLIEVPQ
jgi:hypothetical protein